MSLAAYQAFLDRDSPRVAAHGFAPADLNPLLYPFQAHIVERALRMARAAVFADTGLGKTAIELEFARQVAQHTGRRSLILAPLAVAGQTIRESDNLGMGAGAPGSQCPVHVTNYERLHHLSPGDYAGLVLDESSCIKNHDGMRRGQIQQFADGIDFRLACSATPAPNDLLELGSQSELLGNLTRRQIESKYFVALGNGLRIKGHAHAALWAWIRTWAIVLRRPSDLGFSDDGFTLPALHQHVEVVRSVAGDSGERLFALGLNEHRRSRTASLGARVERVVQIVDASHGLGADEPPTTSKEPWIVWCNLNAEQDALEKAFGDRAISIYGSLSTDEKEKRLLAWLAGERPILITKPKIAGHGINAQNCARIAFCGIDHSYESFYQGIRRCWRYRQAREVHVHVVLAEAEREALETIERKHAVKEKMMSELIADNVASAETAGTSDGSDASGEDWTLVRGDCVPALDALEPDSVGLSVYSPPFPALFVYSEDHRDLANRTGMDGLIAQLEFVAAGVLRATMPGRVSAVHCMQIPASRSRDGYIGLHDFRGEIIRCHQRAGWIFVGEITISANPQAEAVRTKDAGLLFKSLSTDSARMRPALADYIVLFRKPGQNPEPIAAGQSPKYNAGGGWITQDEWIEWATPVWNHATAQHPQGIRQSNTLNVRIAREDADERHLCPLQLDVIRRLVKLYSNPGDLVLSPFAGVGSEGVVSLEEHRRFWGAELKDSYHRTAARNLAQVRNTQQLRF